MTDDRYLGIGANGPLRAADLETAVNDVLGHTAQAGAATRLEGKDALDLTYRPGELHIRLLRVRTRDGRLAQFRDERLILPDPPPPEVLSIGVEVQWELRPVANGSVVRRALPQLVRVAPGEAREAGAELVLDRLSPSGFESVPVWGDRLDCCQSLHAWAGQVRIALHEGDRLLTIIAARLSRVGAPMLLWTALLQPTLSRLAEAVAAFADDEDPQHAARRLGQLLATFDSLPARAEPAGDRNLVTLFQESGFTLPEVPHELGGAAEACEALERLLRDRLAVLQALAQSVGAGLTELPQPLYHEGRLYRKGAALPLTSVRAPAGVSRREVGKVAASAKAAVAFLWDLTGQDIRLGDVRFTPAPTAVNLTGSGEVYLEPLKGSGYHWIADQPLAGARLESGPDLQLIEAAVYEPYD